MQANFRSEKQHQRNRMFGNRKRKPQDNEESLVPHGLIWHATAEPAPEDTTPKEDSLGHTVQFAEMIEQARRPKPEFAIVEPKPASQETSAGSSSPLWWRVRQPESEPAPLIPSKPTPLPLSEYGPSPIKKTEQPRVPPAQTSTARLPQVPMPQTHLSPVPVPRVGEIPAAPMPKPPVAQVPITQVHAPQLVKREIRRYPPPSVKSKRNSDAMLRSIGKVRALSENAGRSTLAGLQTVRTNLLQSLRSLELRKAIVRAGQQGQHLLRAGVALTGRYAQKAGNELTSFSRNSVASVQRISSQLQSISTTTTDVIRPANTKPATPSRVRVLLATSALQARYLAAQRLSEWKVKRDRLAIDTRFWSSMTLAAIAAVLVLAIVSTVTHYAPRSLPSRILNTNPPASTTLDRPAVLPAPHTAGKIPAQKTANPKIAQEKPVQEKQVSTKAATTPKPGRVASDDYVAPDTYKYYGNGSKASASQRR
ncbi:MAG: hypothetical protein AUG89_08465 [Acidobacteria bacterium 13_1_20CM_4_56_7]|nr:MAG: hypothetical protein AUG89_08465 [Acidobacteria bacterium 13_1_20CM_4_56_7]